MSTELGWLTPTVEAMHRLLRLEEGWDSYGARRIEPKAVDSARNLLIRTAKPETPPPIVVPSPRGGVQLEWHMNGIDLEVEAFPEGRFSVYVERPGESIEREGDLPA